MTGRPSSPAGRRGHAWRVLWRFAVGLHLDGKRRTDATFLSRGTQAIEPRWFGLGGASWWAMRPGWQRAALRWLGAALALGLWRWRRDTEWALVLIGAPAAGVAVWVLGQRIARARHHAGVVRPLAAALAPSLESPPAELERTLTVPRHHDHPAARIVAPLPPHWQGAAAQTDAATRIVSQRLGGEWAAQVTRRPLQLVMARRPDPPGMVSFGQVAAAIRGASALRPLMGLGAGDAPYWLDFGAEIAHLGISVGTGGGKSSFLRYLIAQLAYHGVADFPVIDSKMVSLAGMDEIPGLRVYRSVAEQWAALAELRADMDRRYSELLANPAAEFPLCVVLLEEQNDFAIESRAYWREIKASRDPATPPVYADITRLMIKGRQVGYRVIGVYQRLSAAACGGIDAGTMRDAYGMKALSRFGPQAWDALTGLRPRPAASVVPGRWTVVLGGEVHQVQVPYAEAPELVEFVRSSPLFGMAPERPAPGPVPSPASDPDAAVPGGLVVGLAAAAAMLGMTVEGFRKARQRRPVPGELTADDGRPAWPAAELAAWRGFVPDAARVA